MRAIAAKPRLVTTRQAAAALGVSVDTIRRHARAGTLPSVRLGSRGWLKFRRDDIDAVLGRREP